VWKGKYNGREATAKALRISLTSDPQKIERRFCREVVAWKALCHPNVLPLLGVVTAGGQFIMVSEWMTKGNIKDFVKVNTNEDRLGLLRGAIMGLIYRHDQGIVHGNLRGSNILINNSGCACLTDFGLATIISDESTIISTTSGPSITPWMSPELLHPDQFGSSGGRPTKESDCYALGMTIYEVLSGQTPFSKYPAFAIVYRVVGGERPTRPRGEQGAWFTDAIWRMLGLCWKPEPGGRPSLEAVHDCLKDITENAEL